MELSQLKICQMLERFGMKHKEQMCLYQVDVTRNTLSKKGNDTMSKVGDCVHNCLNNSIFVTIMGGVIAFILTLVLGSYGYTWGESKAEREEKTAWRSEHEKGLEKKFDEVKQWQKEITESINKNNDTTKDLLKQILDEQKKSISATSYKRKSNRGEQNDY